MHTCGAPVLLLATLPACFSRLIALTNNQATPKVISTHPSSCLPLGFADRQINLALVPCPRTDLPLCPLLYAKSMQGH
jgi:hypothetical protein